MVMHKVCREAQTYLEGLPRIYHFNDRVKHNSDVFLLPHGANFCCDTNSLIKIQGVDETIDGRFHDLIRVVEIKDAFKICYEKTNVLTPLLYAECLPNILWHITTQGILFTKVSEKTVKWIQETDKIVPYGKHRFDKFWLPCCGETGDIKKGEVLCILNRRVAGWDGALERPVVELLGAGGHLPSIWQQENGRFESLSIEENLIKEANEELHLSISSEDITVFGGYKNDITHELVILAGIMVDDSCLPDMQEYAVTNVDEDTCGIYLGRFDEVMRCYSEDAEYFAGGARAAKINFPTNEKLMKKVWEYLEA